MLAASTLYRQALPYAVRRVVRVQVLHGTTVVADSDSDATYLPRAGTVQAQLQARVTRTVDLPIDPSLYPQSSSDVYAPEQAVVKISAGIGYPDGSRELFPIFTGRVIEVTRSPDGTVSAHCEDYASDVVAARFEQPQASVVGNSIVTEIQRLIRQVLPGAVFGTNDVVDGPVPALVWDVDRGQALDDLAASLGARWYALGDGTFVVRVYPYTASTPVLSMADGDGGMVVSATVKRSRAGVVNSWTVVSERMDGSAPVRSTVRDLVPGSPTMWGGPFGQINQVVKTQAPLSAGQAQQTAAALLSTTRALLETWEVSCVADYTIEPGDTLALSSRGLDGVQVADRVAYPLSTADSMTMSTRSAVTPSQQGG